MAITTEEWIKKAQLKFPNLDFSNTVYSGKMNNITVYCPTHGQFTTKANTLMNSKYGCRECGKEHQIQNKKLSNEEILKRLENSYGSKYDYSKVKYTGAKNKITLICPKHGEFQIRPDCIGDKCMKCEAEERSKRYMLSQEQFECKIKDLSSNIIINSEYKGCNNNIKCKCSICGYEWETKAAHLLEGSNCPKCHLYKGEQKISKYLDINNIKYIIQYKIEKPFENREFILIDFYLPDYNTFIEYNGKQHYIPIKYFGGEIQYKDQIQRDKNLRNYCKENNINLLEIHYDQNVEEKLDEYFSKQELIK